MALIIKCKNKGCGTRLKDDSPCPKCGSEERRYIVDYWPDGRYGKRARYPLPDAIQDKEAAAEYDKQIRASIRTRPEDPQPDRGTTVSELWPDYIAWYKLHRAESTVKDIGNVFENHLKEIFGPVAVMSITSNLFSIYQQTRKLTTVSNRTINKELDYFRGFLRWCRTKKKMRLEAIECDDLPYNRPLPIVLSPDEVMRIFAATEPFWRAFFGCLYTMALRKGEAQKLTWADVDKENRQIRTRQKGGSYKILPASDWLLNCLEAIRPDPCKPGDYVFLTKSTGLPVQNARGAIDRACKKTGITKHVHPHLFRHSIAVHFMSDGINQRMIQSFLGHADAKATEFYTTVTATHLRGMSDRFKGGLSTD